MRTIRYQDIADDLRRRLDTGEFAAGRTLPSEAALREEYDASRVTVRKSLELLRDEGRLDSRQGVGWFVTPVRLSQSLAALATIEGQLAGAGRTSTRRILDFRFVDAPPRIAALLGPRVLETRRLNLADDQPLARVTVWCPERLAADLSLAEVERHSFHDLLPVELGSATQTIGASLVDPADAELLDVPEGSPVLVVDRTTADRSGTTVLVSQHVFPGHLTEFVADLRPGDTDSVPAVRLVEGDRAS